MLTPSRKAALQNARPTSMPAITRATAAVPRSIPQGNVRLSQNLRPFQGASESRPNRALPQPGSRQQASPLDAICSSPSLKDLPTVFVRRSSRVSAARVLRIRVEALGTKRSPHRRRRCVHRGRVGIVRAVDALPPVEPEVAIVGTLAAVGCGLGGDGQCQCGELIRCAGRQDVQHAGVVLLGSLTCPIPPARPQIDLQRLLEGFPRRHGAHRRAVRQALASPLPPAKRAPVGRPAPKLGAHRARIEQSVLLTALS